jgi:hypothetical protein
VRQARVRLSEGQLIEESSATIGSNNRIAQPVGLRKITQMCVQRRSRRRAMMLIVGASGKSVRLDERNNPVPMQHGHVIVVIGGGVPAEKMIVVDAYFVGRVMVADVVIIGLGQRHVNDAQNQKPDSQSSRTSLVCRPAERHVLPSIPGESRSCGWRHERNSVPSRRAFILLSYYGPDLWLGQGLQRSLTKWDERRGRS